jgi:hypothetical protein
MQYYSESLGGSDLMGTTCSEAAVFVPTAVGTCAPVLVSAAVSASITRTVVDEPAIAIAIAATASATGTAARLERRILWLRRRWLPLVWRG